MALHQYPVMVVSGFEDSTDGDTLETADQIRLLKPVLARSIAADLSAATSTLSPWNFCVMRAASKETGAIHDHQELEADESPPAV
jgi:hypothetical protein